MDSHIESLAKTRFACLWEYMEPEFAPLFREFATTREINRRFARAVHCGRWALAVQLEADHTRRFFAWALTGGTQGMSKRPEWPAIQRSLSEWATAKRAELLSRRAHGVVCGQSPVKNS